MGKLIKCKTCKKNVAAECKRCIHCGAKVYSSRNVGCGSGCLVLIISLFIFGVIFNKPLKDREQNSESPQKTKSQAKKVQKQIKTASDIRASKIQNCLLTEYFIVGNIYEIQAPKCDNGAKAYYLAAVVSNGGKKKACCWIFIGEDEGMLFSLNDEAFNVSGMGKRQSGAHYSGINPDAKKLIVYLEEAYTESKSSKQGERSKQMQQALLYLNDIKEIGWYHVYGNDVVVGFKSKPQDWELILKGVAVKANETINSGVHAWAVDASRKSYKPGNSGFWQCVTARNGKIEQ